LSVQRLGCEFKLKESLLQVAHGASPAGSAKFNVTTWIYTSTVQVQNGNQTITVPKDSLKFTIKITDWPFMSSTNKLHFGAAILSQGGYRSDAPMIQPKNTVEQRIQFGPGNLDLANQAVIDGVNQAISATTYSIGTQTGVLWTFPYFKNSLEYDPVLTTSGASASARVTAITWSCVLITVAFILAGSITLN